MSTSETINATLSDEDKALLSISSLPKSNEHFVDTLMYGRHTLSLDEVQSSVNTEELQRKQENLGNSSSEGLTVKVRSEWKKKKQGNNKEKPKNLKCFLCHKKRCFKKDCPKRKLKKKGQNTNAAVVKKNVISMLECVLQQTVKKKVNGF